LLYQYDKAIPEFQKVIELYKKWDAKPIWSYNYANLGDAYYETGQYKKEKRLLKKAEKDFPNDLDLIFLQAVLYINEGDTIMANHYIDKIKSKYKEDSYPESLILSILGGIFSEGKNFEKAEKCNRQALLLEPNNPYYMFALASFLVENDRNINEGLELVEKAIESEPNNYLYLDCKGWGLYKQEKYQDALEVLQKSWYLKPLFYPDIYFHLEAAKKAVASQKK
jgi:tetratricopeptide (TPR) repeat protein